jgi:hypothetical protein
MQRWQRSALFVLVTLLLVPAVIRGYAGAAGGGSWERWASSNRLATTRRTRSRSSSSIPAGEESTQDASAPQAPTTTLRQQRADAEDGDATLDDDDVEPRNRELARATRITRQSVHCRDSDVIIVAYPKVRPEPAFEIYAHHCLMVTLSVR